MSTYEDYLALERTTATRHEWRRGQVLPRAIASPRHTLICANVIRALGQGAFSVHTSEQKIRIERSDRTTYPDVSVVSTKRRHSGIDPGAIVNPSVLIEVIADATEASDRGEKAAAYRCLDALREYVLITEDTPHVEVYEKAERGEWLFREHFAGERFQLPSLGVVIEVDTLYLDPTA